MNNELMFSSKSNEWATPQAFFDELNKEFNFTLDVSATSENAKCSRYFTKNEDGLIQDWSNDVCWMNPPYGREIGKWIEKAYLESQKGATVVCLIPARTDTKYFHEFCFKGEVRFVRGRLKFGNAGNAPFPSAVVIFRNERHDFESNRAVDTFPLPVRNVAVSK